MESWVISLLIFGATQIGSLIWILASQRVESRVVRVEIFGVQKELEKLSNVVETQADMRGEIKLLNDRMNSQGKRLDEEISRSNLYRDKLLRQGEPD